MDKLCLGATALFLASSALRAIYLDAFDHRDHWDDGLWKAFDAQYIQTEWGWLVGFRPLEAACGILNVAAWFCLTVPILQVTWIQSSVVMSSSSSSSTPKEGIAMTYTDYYSPILHILVALLATGGAFFMLFAQIFILGATNALEWIYRDYQLDTWITGNTGVDNLGYKTLEFAHTTTRGMSLWVAATEVRTGTENMI
jgi:hypothetical protein